MASFDNTRIFQLLWLVGLPVIAASKDCDDASCNSASGLSHNEKIAVIVGVTVGVIAGVVILVCVGIAIFGVFRWRRIRRYRKEFRRQTTAVRGLRAQNSTHEMRNTNQSLPQGPVVGSQRPGASHAYQPVGQPEEADNHNRTTPTPRQSIEGDGNDGQTPPRYARE
ncbi:hypothetical protein HDZ31DRAFT_61408 [Schizophyllum fasciatum]